MRNEDFVLAARSAGAGELYIILGHLVPSFMIYVLVHLSLAVPNIFVKNAQKLTDIAIHPWILSPAVFVVLVVLAFNFISDGLRDAADPYADL